MLGRICSALALAGAIFGVLLVALVLLICVTPFVLMFCSLNDLRIYEVDDQ